MLVYRRLHFTVLLFLAILICVVFIWFVLPILLQQNRVPVERAADVSCGPQSLRVAALRLGVPVAATAVSQMLVDPVYGATIGDLKETAAQVGLIAESRLIGLDELRRHAGTAVLLIRGQHFVAVDPREKHQGSSFRVYDSDLLAAWWSDDELSDVWEGEALLLKRRPIPPPADASQLEWDSCLCDLGIVSNPRSADFQFEVRNNGTADLRLKIDGTSCNCAQAALTSELISPGETSQLTVSVDLLRKSSSFSESVVIRSNDPDRPFSKIILRGSSLGQTSSARSLHFGAIYPTDKKTRYFLIRDPGDRRLRINSAVCSPQVSDTPIPSVQFESVITQVENPTDWASRLPMGVNASRGDFVIAVTATVADHSLEGKFAGMVEVETSLPDDWSKFEVLLEGIVDSPIMADPLAIRFPLKGQDFMVADVSLSHVLNKLLKIKGTSISGKLSLRVEMIETVGRVVSFRVFCEATSESDRIQSGTVVCELDDGRIVRIPVVYTPGKK